MFKLHSLSVDALSKIRKVMNQVVVGRDRTGRHLTKDSSVDILSLADQLYRSKSTIPEGPEPGKMYFSENPAPDLLLDELKALPAQVEALNKSVKDKRPVKIEVDGDEDGITFGSRAHPIELPNVGSNEIVNELFLSARESASLTSNLTDVFI